MPGREVFDWIAVAEEDYQLALKAIRARKHPLRRGACYHSQQCAEKYLKAFLIHHNRRFPFTHDLLALKDLCAAADPLFVLDEAFFDGSILTQSTSAILARNHFPSKQNKQWQI